jgi:hypothetical protein
MNPKNRILYNRYDNSNYDPSTGKEIIDKATEQFHLTVPVDRVSSSEAISTFWKEEATRAGMFTPAGMRNPSSYVEEQDFINRQLVHFGYTKISQNIAHVLPVSFFAPEDYDHAAKCIIVPLNRLLDNHKFALEVMGRTILFVESARNPGTMIPFIYTSSHDPLPFGAPGYRHSFQTPSEHNEWSIIIVTPEYGAATPMIATPIVTQSLYTTINNSPGASIRTALLDHQAIQDIINDILFSED